MVWAATAATVVSAGAAAYSASQQGKGGSGGGGGAQTGMTNPAMPYIGDLFGNYWDRKKGWRKAPWSTGIFGETEKGYLKDLMAPNPIYQPALDVTNSAIDRSIAAIPQAQEDLGTAMGWLRGAAAGPTSIDPIIAARKWDLYNNVVPDLGERFSGSTGIFGAATDFWGSLNRASAGMEAELGAKEFDAQEAWKNRMLQAAPAYGTLGTTRGILPISMASDILRLGVSKQQAVQGAKPGNQVLALLTQLGGMGSNSQNSIYQAGYKPTSDTADMISALGQSIPGIINAWPRSTTDIGAGQPRELAASIAGDYSRA